MRSRLILAVFPLLVALMAPAAARGTLDSILPEIRAQHPGRLSDAEPWTDAGGNTHYRIKWMTPEGRILYFDADSRTGRYSNSGGDAGNQWRRNREDDGAMRNRWNGEEGGGDWRRGGDWPDGGNGDWRGRETGGGDWRGLRGGGWRGGHNGGDNGGGHHHGH